MKVPAEKVTRVGQFPFVLESYSIEEVQYLLQWK